MTEVILAKSNDGKSSALNINGMWFAFEEPAEDFNKDIVVRAVAFAYGLKPMYFHTMEREGYNKPENQVSVYNLTAEDFE